MSETPELELYDELSQNFIEYAAAINSDRSIPDSTTGLKPVARRILWSMFNEGQLSSKPHVKSAHVVGNVLAQLHPHGDASVYGALVRLSQNWVMRYSLVDIHGNNGNIAGDGAASMRYTEARLSKIAEEGLFQGIKKHNVDFDLTYDDANEEPITLPAVFPNLLCNPNSGIGVALATSWAPHNLREVAQAIFDYMDGQEPTLPGPDFPTGGVIINKNTIPEIMRTGRGTVKIRGKYTIEDQNIVFYEIPYGVTIENILDEINNLYEKKEIEHINDIRDESNKKGIRIVIQCDKDIDPNILIPILFAKTSLQSSFSYNQMGLVNKTPTLLNLKDCIKIYIEHNLNCIKREAEFDLQKAQSRQHIVEGLLKALEDIDNIIALIKQSKSAGTAQSALISRYKFSEIQAKAIIDMKLGKLAGLEKIELEEENQELSNKIDTLTNLIKNDILKKEELKKRLSNLVSKYGDDRRTELLQLDEDLSKSKEPIAIIPEDVIIILTQNNNIKKIPTANFKVQRRGGVGQKSNNNNILDTIKTNTVDTLMLFSSTGKMYRILVDKIPDNDNGININSLLDIDFNEQIVAITSLHRDSSAEYAVFITKNGIVKKTLLSEYDVMKHNKGIAALKFKDGDSLANVTFLNDEDLILLTKNGMSIHCSTKSMVPTSRVTIGKKAIALAKDDKVIVGLPIHKDTDNINIITQAGLGKQCKLSDFPLQTFGGKGIKIYDAQGNRDYIVGAAMVDDTDNILLITNNTNFYTTAKSIPVQSRKAAGVKVTKSNHVKSIVKIKGI